MEISGVKPKRLAQDLRQGNGYAPDLIEAKMAEKVNDTIIREIAKQEKAIETSERVEI